MRAPGHRRIILRGRAGSGRGPAIRLCISDLGLLDGSGQGLMRSLRRLSGLSGIAVSALDNEGCIENAVRLRLRPSLCQTDGYQTSAGGTDQTRRRFSRLSGPRRF